MILIIVFLRNAHNVWLLAEILAFESSEYGSYHLSDLIIFT